MRFDALRGAPPWCAIKICSAWVLTLGASWAGCVYSESVGGQRCQGAETRCDIPEPMPIPIHMDEKVIDTNSQKLTPIWERPLLLPDGAHRDEDIFHGVLLATGPGALWHARANADADMVELFSLDLEGHVLSQRSITAPASSDPVQPPQLRVAQIGVNGTARTGSILELGWVTPCVSSGTRVDVCSSSFELVFPELDLEEPGARHDVEGDASQHPAVRAHDGKLWSFEFDSLHGYPTPGSELRQGALSQWYLDYYDNVPSTFKALAAFSNGDLGLVYQRGRGQTTRTDLWRFDASGSVTLVARQVFAGASLVDAFLVADREQRWLVISRTETSEGVSVRRWSPDLSNAEEAYLLRGVLPLEFQSVAEDETGNVFVLMLAGNDIRDSQHLLCKIPLAGSPACYAVPLLTGNNIVAAGDSQVYAEAQLLVQGADVDRRTPLFETHLQRFDVP